MVRVGDFGQGSRDQHPLKHSRGVRREGGQVLLGYWDFDVDVNESLNTHR